MPDKSREGPDKSRAGMNMKGLTWRLHSVEKQYSNSLA